MRMDTEISASFKQSWTLKVKLNSRHFINRRDFSDSVVERCQVNNGATIVIEKLRLIHDNNKY